VYARVQHVHTGVVRRRWTVINNSAPVNRQQL